MKPVDFIMREIRIECARRGIRDDFAERAAGIAAVRFQENRFASHPTDLIVECVRIVDTKR